MAGGPAYLLVPGLFGQYYPCYLWNVRQHFQAVASTRPILSSTRAVFVTETLKPPEVIHKRYLR